jgi:hypothetical protein
MQKLRETNADSKHFLAGSNEWFRFGINFGIKTSINNISIMKISIAKTGSGKTLGFILPAIVHVVSQKKQNSMDGPAPAVVVLLPTRELAQQVYQ